MSSSGYIGLLYILDILVTITDTKAFTYVSCFEALSELKQGGNYLEAIISNNVNVGVWGKPVETCNL